MKRSRRNSCSGFTIIELLVVMGLIAILVGLLFPMLRNARRDSEQIKCAAQLRQLGAGLVAYSTAHRGAMPTWSSWHVTGGDGTGEDAPGPAWTEQLARYFAEPRSPVYNCPSFPDEYPINYFLAARWSNVCGRQHMSFHDIKRSSEFILSGDCTGPSLYRSPFGTRSFTTDDCDKDDAIAIALAFADEPKGGLNVHRGGNNVLFGDTHVEVIRKFDITRMTYHPRRMQAWNDVTPE